jgi:endoglucanase
MDDRTVLRATRRMALSAPAALLLGRGAAAEPAAATPWALFKQRFLTPEGRILDSDNGGISHSEGQAWGLLLAGKHDDWPAFERILRWTRGNLAIRGDRLLAWRYRPMGGVDDINSATDADLFYAWALLRADRRWPGQGLRALAAGVATDILRVSCRQFEGRTMLMPGAWGFDHADHLVLNPSYYAFPALEAIALSFPHPGWPALIAEGDRILAQARFGRWGLPADWVELRRRGGAMEPQRGRGDRFGNDAVRIPLYLAWSGRWQASPMAAIVRFWNEPAHPFQPAWVRLSTGAISPYPASVGAAAIRALVSPQNATRPLEPARQDGGYYSNCLSLLAECAAAEGPPHPDGLRLAALR